MIKLTKPSMSKFQLGQIVATPEALQAIRQANQTPAEFIRRHIVGDWDDLCQEDKQLNNEAIAHEETAGTENDIRGRVLSAYYTKLNEKIYVITEWTREVTTILLPSEY